MRLFIAIDIAERAIQVLKDIQDSNLEMRWTTPETMHLTLRFVGDTEEELKNSLVRELTEIDHYSFEIYIKGLGYFPPRKYPKILWAGIQENNSLMELQKKVEKACRNAGLDPEERSFKPHITIGRVQGASKKEVLSFINEHKRLRFEDISVKKFILYESKLHPDGAVHTPLEYFPLTTNSDRDG